MGIGMARAWGLCLVYIATKGKQNMCQYCNPGFIARLDQEIAEVHGHITDVSNRLHECMRQEPNGTDLDWLSLLLDKLRNEYTPEQVTILAGVALIRLARDKARGQEVVF